jgi:hypothetical protein
MAQDKPLSACISLDIGRINTRAAYFGIEDGKFRLGGFAKESTDLNRGLHLGIGQAIQALQTTSGQVIQNDVGGLIMPVNAHGEGVDLVALTVSAGPEIKTGLLGLAESGSIYAGRALIDSLPLKPIIELDLYSLLDDAGAINALFEARPELMLITGGEVFGTGEHVQQWIDIVRLVCQQCRDAFKPTVIYAGNLVDQVYARRRLEPVTNLLITSNLMPETGTIELQAAQNLLETVILNKWKSNLPGYTEFSKLTRGLEKLSSQSHGRMVRYLGRQGASQAGTSQVKGVLAIDLGGSSTVLSAAQGLNSATVNLPTCLSQSDVITDDFIRDVHRWTAAPVSKQMVHQFLAHLAVHPFIIPENLTELAISQAFASRRIVKACNKFSEYHHWFNYNQTGLNTQYEPVILSGSVFTSSPAIGETILMLLNGMQLSGITTLVLDRHHLLPQLGTIAAVEPILPVHILASSVFENLGTVLVPVSSAAEGKALMKVRVSVDSGKQYEVDIVQGTLRRIVVPPGVSAVLKIMPERHTDIGFGGKGIGGQIKVKGGALGVVVDARGRPINLPEDDESRVEILRKWLWSLGG